jgi:hypothetical protein
LQEDLQNPYRRALLYAGLNEIKGYDDHMLEALYKILPEVITNVVTSVGDVIGTSLINIQLKKGSKIKTLFPKFREKQKQQDKNIIKLPDGTMVEIEVDEE